MATKSKSSGWWRAAETALTLAGAACLVLLAGCGEKDPPPGSHWTAQYKAFGGNKPSAHVELNWNEFLDRPVLGEVKIAAPSVMTALAELNSRIRNAGAKFDLQITQVEPEHKAYQKPVDLKLDDPTVAEVIDRIARDAGGLVWDFQGEQLVIRPKEN